MTRDLGLVREILLTLEAHEHGYAPGHLRIEGYSIEQVGYHVLIMAEGGLLRASEVTGKGDHTPVALPIRMTWQGHEFLDLSRNESVWEKANQSLQTAGCAGFAILLAVLKNMVRESVLDRHELAADT